MYLTTVSYTHLIFLSDYIGLNRIVCGLNNKKMPYLYLIDEAIGLLNIEIRIVKWRIKYPEQFQQHANKLFLSPLHLDDKTSLVNIMEIVSGLFLSKRIVYQLSLIHISKEKALERD